MGGQDGDFVGDNQDGNNPDLCPDTDDSFASQVDEDGCAANQRDSDNDLIDDYRDPCPFEPEEMVVPLDVQLNSRKWWIRIIWIEHDDSNCCRRWCLFALILMLIVIRRVFSEDLT